MPEGSIATHTQAKTDKVARQKGAPKLSPEQENVNALKKKYDDLAKQTTEAVNSGADPREVARLKALKGEAFKTFHDAESKYQHDQLNGARAKGQTFGGIDPGSPIVAQ